MHNMTMESGPKTPDAARVAEALKQLGLEVHLENPKFLEFLKAAVSGELKDAESLDSLSPEQLVSRIDRLSAEILVPANILI